MNEPFDIFKKEIGKYNSGIQLIAGFAITILGISGLAIHIFESKLNIALISIGAFFVIKKVCKIIIKAKRETFNVTTEYYSKRTIKIAKALSAISYLLWMPPAYFLFTSALNKKEGCMELQKVGLLVTRFSLAEDDNFSYLLSNRLEAEIQDCDTINVIRANQVINVGTQDYLDSLKKL